MQMSPTSQLLDDYNKNYQLDYWKRYTVDDNWALKEYGEEIKTLALVWVDQLQKQLFSKIVKKPKNYQVTESLTFLALYRTFDENKRFLPKKMTKNYCDNFGTIDKFLIFRVFTRTLKNQIEQLADIFNEVTEDYQFSLLLNKEKFSSEEKSKIKKQLWKKKLSGNDKRYYLSPDLKIKITLTAKRIPS